jgi:hypothetical protein
MPTKRKRTGKGKYTDQLAIDIALLALTGANDRTIAKTIGIHERVLADWRDAKPLVAYALNRARSSDFQSVKSFSKYVYKCLSPKMRRLWDRIEFYQEHPNAHQRINALLAEQGLRVRQSLFVHAMIQANFNASEACRMISLPYAQFRRWVYDDPGFRQLLDEVHWHKQNWVEGSLMNLIATGNTLATIFASRTLNRDRGYSDKVDVNVTGTIKHDVSVKVVRVDELKLSIETRRELLQALRERKQPLYQRALDVPQENALALPTAGVNGENTRAAGSHESGHARNVEFGHARNVEFVPDPSPTPARGPGLSPIEVVDE